MLFQTDDLRIESLRSLIPPAILVEELPLGEKGAETIVQGREQAQQIISGEDDRLLVVVGPCSIHDPLAALDYARRLKDVADETEAELLITMRVYFEKPRTIVGWKGLINDPNLDGSFAINDGLRLARRLLLELAEDGIPAACEFLDPITPQFFADLVSWGAIGARTSESQVHRELASGLSMPVGFKNGTDGSIQVAIDAIRSASHPHHFVSVNKQGVAAIVETRGNNDCHVILRGGKSGPNYDVEAVEAAATSLRTAGLPPRLMVDCSHGNSSKNPAMQPKVAADIAERIEGGDTKIFGLMLESFIEDGRQDPAERQELTYGQSITDGCMGWKMTVPTLKTLASAIKVRRERVGS